MKALFTILLCSMSLGISAQDILPKWQSDITENFNKLRLELLEDSSSVAELQSVIRRWLIFEPDTADCLDLFFNVHIACNIHGNSLERFQKKASILRPNSNLPDLMRERDIEILAENSDLVDLICNSIIEFGEPFSMKLLTFERLNFYELKAGEIIAEIGAGRGMFAQYISMIDSDITLYINELSKNFVKYIEAKKSRKSFGLPNNKVNPIQGKKKSCKLTEKVDKIIIENSLHHFSKMEEMLTSIKKSMKPNGKLLLYEGLKSESGCKLKLTEKELKNILESNGFILLREEHLEEGILLEYEIVSKEK